MNNSEIARHTLLLEGLPMKDAPANRPILTDVGIVVKVEDHWEYCAPSTDRKVKIISPYPANPQVWRPLPVWGVWDE
jgi:hypothetical protein